MQKASLQAAVCKLSSCHTLHSSPSYMPQNVQLSSPAQTTQHHCSTTVNRWNLSNDHWHTRQLPQSICQRSLLGDPPGLLDLDRPPRRRGLRLYRRGERLRRRLARPRLRSRLRLRRLSLERLRTRVTSRSYFELRSSTDEPSRPIVMWPSFSMNWQNSEKLRKPQCWTRHRRSKMRICSLMTPMLHGSRLLRSTCFSPSMNSCLVALSTLTGGKLRSLLHAELRRVL